MNVRRAGRRNPACSHARARTWIGACNATLFLTIVACGGADAQLDASAPPQLACTVGAAVPLPEVVRETSGLAVGAGGLLWTHNDRGSDPVLYAIDARGALRAAVRVNGVSDVDWEDVDSAPCGDATCVYIGDIGDNNARRDEIAVHVVREPAAGARDAVATQSIHLRYPDGPQDAEALFVLNGRIHIVTKGEHGPVALYRVPEGDGAAESPLVLERVRQLGSQRGADAGKITGASASPDGRWVGIRSYASLHLFDASALVSGAPVEPLHFDLRPLREPQGEGVAIAESGEVWLSSESEGGDVPPSLTRLACRLPGD